MACRSMDRTIKIVLLLGLTGVHCGVVPAPRVLEGPSSKTTLIGPDGSKISAFAPGGKIVLDENPGPVLQGAPEVVAVAGVAQPPVEVVEEVAPVVEVVTEVKPNPETAPVEVSSVLPSETEVVEISKSAVTENTVQVEGTTTAVSVCIEQHTVEAQSEPVESSTGSPIEEKVTENPLSVVPLAGEVEYVAESQPSIAYTQDSPLYVPEYSEFEGRYTPENSFEQAMLRL